jgi:hypothetical protein
MFMGEQPMCRLTPFLLMLPFVLACSEQDVRNAATSNSLRQVGLAIQDTSQKQATDENAATTPTAGRQIIYKASIDLHVKSFADADRRITALVNESGGFIAQFREDRRYGTQRGGHWTIRVPVAQFTVLLDAVSQLGVAERREVQSQDVTEEYVDLESRLKNKQTLESRLLELVSKRGDAIKDVLALETELSRVREEIEKLQGRMRYLSDRVALTTIEIQAYERLDYEPPNATLAQRISSTFLISLDRLRQFGEAVVLIGTAALPWAVTALLLFLPMGMIMRRRRRAHASTMTASAT